MWTHLHLGLLAAVLLTGCTSVVSPPSDSFSGVYRIIDKRETGIITIKRHSNGYWFAESRKDEQTPLQSFPVSNYPYPQPLMIAPVEAIPEVFDQSSPQQRIQCLGSAPGGPIVICQIPRNTPYRLISAMFGASAGSKTGYILVVGTPAGAYALDLSHAVE